MKLKISAKAEDYINQKTEQFLSWIEPLDEGPRQPPKLSSVDESHVTQIDVDQILNFSLSTVDSFGIEHARYFDFKGGQHGLAGDNFVAFKKFVSNIYKNPNLSKFISEEYLADNIFSWFKEKLNKDTDDNYCDYLIHSSQNDIKEHTVQIPLSGVAIEEAFSLDNISIGYFKKDLFNRIEKRLMNEAKEEEKDAITSFVLRLKKDYQGCVYIQFKVVGESKSCIQHAMVLAASFMSILQFYSPAAFSPRIKCNIGLLGQVFIHKEIYFVTVKNDEMPVITEKISPQSGKLWHLDKVALDMLQNSGFLTAIQLFNKQDRTELEELVLRCISIYSKGITFHGLQEKLIFYLVSLETLLLKNQDESIQRNVSLRLAHMIGTEASKKKQIIDLIPKAYKDRSKFIHHGKEGVNIQVLEDLQFHIWNAIYHALINTMNFQTKEELISYLEDRIIK